METKMEEHLNPDGFTSKDMIVHQNGQKQPGVEKTRNWGGEKKKKK